MIPIKPAGLRRGDTIGVVAPAGPVDPQKLRRALERLHSRGFHTKTYGDLFRSQGYLAGDDATRAREWMDAFADPQTAAVWCARGGYGTARIVDKIDFGAPRRHPKVFIGFSDISILHAALAQRVGLCTFHAPNLQDGFGGEDDMLPETEAALWRLVMADKQNPGDANLILAQGGLRAIAPGVAAGRLVGGNLAVLCGLMGTPFEIDTAGCILFLEDIDERLYRVDRYLAQLTLAGKLQSAAGVLLGDFTCELRAPSETAAEVEALFAHYLGGLGIPVLAGLRAGHILDNLALPLNALVEIDSYQASLRLREPAVH